MTSEPRPQGSVSPAPRHRMPRRNDSKLPESPRSFFISAGWRFRDSIGIGETVLQRVINAVEKATEARRNAHAPCSGFKVGVSLDLGDSRYALGANFEFGAGYGLAENRAIHAEVAAVSDAINSFGCQFNIEIVSVVAESEIPISSGECLDVLQTFASPKTLVVAASLNKIAHIYTIEALLPGEFESVRREDLPVEHQALIDRAVAVKGRSSQAFSRNIIGLSGAAALSDRGQIYDGPREDSLSFNPVSAVEAAFSHSRAHGDPFITALAYTSGTGHLSGWERQRICEKAHRLERMETMPVYILKHSGELQMATPRALLPHAFLSVHRAREAENL